MDVLLATGQVTATTVFPLERISFRIRDEQGMFCYRIRFAIYIWLGDSEVITSRFGNVSRDFLSEYLLSEYC